MRWIRLAPLVLAVALLALAQPAQAMPAEGQNPDNLRSVRIGREVAKQHCARCHAIGRKGLSPNAKAPPFAEIAERYPDSNPAPDLVDGTVIRHPGMPEFRLIEVETDGLVAYLRRISRKWQPSRGF